MKLVAAPNALKGSLSAFAAAASIARGARRARPDTEVIELGVADGGDGTAEVMCRARGGSFREATVLDPLGRPRLARYAWLNDGTAVIDVATASGLALLQPNERDALAATSYGTGELLRAALEASAARVVLGVGGSATVDGGAGILEALGARLLDADGKALPRGRWRAAGLGARGRESARRAGPASSNKGPLGVARRAATRGVPVVALAGRVESDVTERDFPQFAGIFSICAQPMPEEEAMRDAGPLLEAAAERVVRSFAPAQ